MVAPSEFLQRDERSLVSHFGKRVGAPKTTFLGCVFEILAENAVRFRPMVMRKGFRGLPSGLGMFLLISEGLLQRRDRGLAVRSSC
jgi:hypothetical protein